MSSKSRVPTISQIAERAGVARSSVSRAFTRPELLSAATVLRIKRVAKELGYVPNSS
ncbi:MAG: LacI family DNA-binding transcriptional regulator, partial [bacterium]